VKLLNYAIFYDKSNEEVTCLRVVLVFSSYRGLESLNFLKCRHCKYGWLSSLTSHPELLGAGAAPAVHDQLPDAGAALVFYDHAPACRLKK